MSNYYENPLPPAPAKIGPAPQENIYGLIGFILSLVGLVICVAALPGLILSVIGLRKEPKVFAIIGTIVGSITMLFHTTILLIYGAFFLACIGVGIAAQPMIVTMASLQEAGHQIENAKDAGGAYPDEAAGNKLIGGMTDYWQGTLRYEPTAGGYVIRSSGPDKQFNTSDDVTMNDDQFESFNHHSADNSWPPSEQGEDENVN